MPGDKPLLLDVNVLIALFDSAHIHHATAHGWFGVSQARGWRTCPITENGLLRILSHPGYPNQPLPSAELARRLENFKTGSVDHCFWPDDFSLSQWMAAGRPAIPSSRITDVYLLGLASSNGGVLATFDLQIEPSLIGETDSGIVEHLAT